MTDREALEKVAETLDGKLTIQLSLEELTIVKILTLLDIMEVRVNKSWREVKKINKPTPSPNPHTNA